MRRPAWLCLLSLLPRCAAPPVPFLSDHARAFLSGSSASPACDAPARDDLCLLLLSHSAVLRYCVQADTVQVLAREDNARFRGAFLADEADAIWLLASPLGHGAAAPSEGSVLARPAPDELRLLDLRTEGAAPRTKLVAMENGDAHEVLRRGDEIFVVNTRKGSVVQARVPHEGDAGLEVLAEHALWARLNHVNQIALLPGVLLVNSHNRGKPSVVQAVDLNTGLLANVVEGVGRAAHGLALWRDCGAGKTYFVNLDSGVGGLGLMDLGDVTSYATVWKDPGGGFSKGLAVVDNVAYFGLSQAQAGLRSRLAVQVTLVALDLAVAAAGTGADPVLWRREVPFRGLVNQILSPLYLPMPPLGSEPIPRERLAATEAATAAQESSTTPGPENAVPAAVVDLKRFEHAKPMPPGPEVQANGRLYHAPGWRVPEGAVVVSRESKGGATRMRAERVERKVDPLKARLALVRKQDRGRVAAPAVSTQEHEFTPEERRAWATEGLHPDALRNAGDLGSLATDDELVGVAFAPGDAGHEALPLAEKQHAKLDARHLADVYRSRGPVPSSEALRAHLEDAIEPIWWKRDYAQEHNAIFVGRESFMQKFKKDVDAIILKFSERTGRVVYEFPWYEHFRPQIEAIFGELGIDPAYVVRVQLARMPPGSTIRLHVDNGGWVKTAHRIHVPLKTNDRVVFLSRVNGNMMRIPTVQDQAFEINNKSPHAVFNRGSEERIHLLVDVAEEVPDVHYKLRVGEQCDYNSLPEGCGERVPTGVAR